MLARLDALADSELHATDVSPCNVRKDGDATLVSAMGNGGADQCDDLKRLSGVGPRLEAKLHKLGVTRFEQVAAWEKADIERIGSALRFKGRIEREGWVVQARQLAADGPDGGRREASAKTQEPRGLAAK